MGFFKRIFSISRFSNRFWLLILNPVDGENFKTQLTLKYMHPCIFVQGSHDLNIHLICESLNLPKGRLISEKKFGVFKNPQK